MRIPTYLTLHHSAVSHDKNPDQFLANNAYHEAQWNMKSSLGFYLGYTYEISRSGKVLQARADGEATAAVTQSWALYGVLPRFTGWMNDGRAIHICLDGNFDIEKPEPAQIYALRDLLKKLASKYKIPPGNLYLHRNFTNQKSCPGTNLDLAFVRSLISKA